MSERTSDKKVYGDRFPLNYYYLSKDCLYPSNSNAAEKSESGHSISDVLDSIITLAGCTSSERFRLFLDSERFCLFLFIFRKVNLLLY